MVRWFGDALESMGVVDVVAITGGGLSNKGIGGCDVERVVMGGLFAKGSGRRF